MLETSARLLRLLALFQSRVLWSGAELAERLEVTERSVRRDVDRLRSLGYPVHASRGLGGGYRLGVGTKMPPLLLDDQEAIAVAVSLRTAAGGTVEGIGEASMRALSKLEQVLPSRLRSEVAALQASTVSLPAGTPTVDPETLVVLARCCRDGERVTFDYRSHGGTTTRRRVEPYRLVSTGRRWYLVARDQDRDDWRTFRVDRLGETRATASRFQHRSDAPDPVGLVTRGVATGPYRCVARVRLHIGAAAAAERVPPTTGVITALDDSSCELSTGADTLEAIGVELLILGCDFDVIEPAGLTEVVHEMGLRMVRGGGLPGGLPANGVG
jgi:predicted DNA-binding transcriptional regulator YafY